MGLSITAKNVERLATGLWSFEMPPHQVRFFGDCRKAEGERSILLLKKAIFDPAGRNLVFDADDASALNVGSTSVALAVSADAEPGQQPVEKAKSEREFGHGDREFLKLVEELPPPGQEAAKHLLNAIRSKYPGDLKRGLMRNFSNTPDNFWYVIVQPRVGELSITVRGLPERFGQTKLDLKEDRPGYSRFKVSRPEDVEEACRIIFASKKQV